MTGLNKRLQPLLRLSLVGLVLISAAGCARLAPAPPTPVAVRPAAQAVDLDRTSLVRSKLELQHRAWAGTRYRYGGLSKKGIDCSGLVYLTFQEQLGLALPRTTAGQVKVGHAVSKSELRPGDLVFFRTGFKVRHVGIYMGDRQFLHASSSSGVTVSSLDNPYWHASYWHARRP